MDRPPKRSTTSTASVGSARHVVHFLLFQLRLVCRRCSPASVFSQFIHIDPSALPKICLVVRRWRTTTAGAASARHVVQFLLIQLRLIRAGCSFRNALFQFFHIDPSPLPKTYLVVWSSRPTSCAAGSARHFVQLVLIQLRLVRVRCRRRDVFFQFCHMDPLHRPKIYLKVEYHALTTRAICFAAVQAIRRKWGS